jgi:hypothetical protein
MRSLTRGRCMGSNHGGGVHSGRPLVNRQLQPCPRKWVWWYRHSRVRLSMFVRPPDSQSRCGADRTIPVGARSQGTSTHRPARSARRSGPGSPPVGFDPARAALRKSTGPRAGSPPRTPEGRTARPPPSATCSTRSSAVCRARSASSAAAVISIRTTLIEHVFDGNEKITRCGHQSPAG